MDGSESETSDSSVRLIAEARRARQDFDDAIGAIAAQDGLQSHSQSQSQSQSQAPTHQHQLQQQQPRTRKFDGHRIRNLSSRIRGRVNHQEQHQYQKQSQSQCRHQNRNQSGEEGTGTIGSRRASTLENAWDEGIPTFGEYDDDHSNKEARMMRQRASDVNIAPARERRGYRHAHTCTLPLVDAAPTHRLQGSCTGSPQPHHAYASSVPGPPSRSLSRDELRALGRKAGAAVAGGSLIALGLPLCAMPGPVGECMSIGGTAVLAKEFPAAQRVLDVSRDKLVEVLDKTAPPEADEVDDGDDDNGEHDDGEHNDDDQEGRRQGLDSNKRAYRHHGGSTPSDDGDGGVIGAATNLSQRCAHDSVRYNQREPSRPLPPLEGDYFHLHDELLASHRHNYHQGHYGHRGHYNHRRQGSWRNHRNKNKKNKKNNKGPSKLKRSLHGPSMVWVPRLCCL